ncbi:MAG: hypothetical protein COT84_07665 [Chlamydiae bacterium CG10_big_fil_rev_8_21_14_0_10_35_9]|nr:MAG: hypothetical protein COT84_07665 [Chlamydiae bacterium CG10_big_fil_rev_8_21_14_0_10_35_9]
MNNMSSNKIDKTHLLQRFFNRIFPQKNNEVPDKWMKLSVKEKNELSKKYLSKAETLLQKNDLKALKYFEAASELAPSDPENWFRQGVAFYQYAILENQEKAFQLANKNFTVASQLDTENFDIWLNWGLTLTQLGKAHSELHFLTDAKAKFETAIRLSDSQSPEKKGDLYWKIGLLWTAISEASGEAIDLRMAIQSFCTSSSYQNNASSDFWRDFGNAYLQMGLLINDSKMYFQSIEYFRKVVKSNSESYEGWFCLAQAYTQLYINTIDEHYYNHAHECFTQALKKNNTKIELWLNWAQLLGEAGILNKDPQRLKLATQKCIRAQNIDPRHPLVIGQWTESLSQLGLFTNRLDLMIESENKIIKAVDQFPDEPELWYAYGVCLMAFGKYYEEPDFIEAAIEKIQHGISLDRSCAELWHILASAYYELGYFLEDVEIFQQSCDFFSRACDLKPSCPSLSFGYAKALLKLAECTADIDSLKKGTALLEAIIQSHKTAILQHPNWLFYYALSLFLLGELTDEEKYYTKAIELFLHVILVDPQYPDIYFKTALCFSHLAEITLEKEVFSKAINYFMLAVKQEPENDQIWLEWGLTLTHLADLSQNETTAQAFFKEAEQKIMRSGQLGNQHAYYQMACLLSLTRRYSQAMEFIEKAQLFDALPPIEEIMEDDWLENLRYTQAFSDFIACLETNQNTAEEL